MTKKRVYELAKELGLENRELIARIAKIGIMAKSHSSALEDGDVERIYREIRGIDSREMVEKRITSTIIRRRAVRSSSEADEENIESESGPDKEEQTTGKEQDDRGNTIPIPPSSETSAPPAEPPVERKPSVSGSEIQPIGHEKQKMPEEQEQPKVKKEDISVPPVLTDAHVPGKETEPLPAPDETVKGQSMVRAPQGGATLPLKKAIDGKVEPETTVPVPKSTGGVVEVEIKTVSADADKGKKKKKDLSEQFIEESFTAKKKIFLKKGSNKKGNVQEIDREETPSRWREEKKIIATKMNKTQITTPKAIKRRIRIGETIGVGEMAKKMGVKVSEVISKLMANGMLVTINQSIDFDVATLIASEFGYQIEAAAMELEEAMMKPVLEAKNLQTRAPIVTIMGHVDHGKTSLLDAIRSTNVIGGEAGGITQAIGAYRVHINGRDIVFLDTPGHEAFTAMRARGAKVTDVVVLVVAADDGIMSQTIEAIHHSRVAKVPILVAINKMDKPAADPGKIKQSLTEHGLVPEEWGGETIFCEVSAKKKEGIEELLEMILLQADVLDLKADPDLPVRGVIVEAKLDRGRGPLATVLIQEGTLHEGDAFVSKMEWGRVRSMYNDQGVRVREAGPSTPVEVIGFSSVPHVSAEFIGMADEKKARNIAEYWIRKDREKELSSTSKVTLEHFYQKIREGAKDLNVILKADVQGAIEALSDAFNKLTTNDIKLNIIHSSSGAITETDVMLASASNAIIIGFNVRPDNRVSELAEQEGVEIKLYDIIYNAIADVRAAMEGLLDPEYKDVVQGRAEIRELFRVPKVGTIAGSFIIEGKITRKSNVRLVRDGIQIFDGKILSLKRFKDDAKEVLSGFECGIGIEGFNDLRQGDVIEAYAQEKIERKL